MARLYSQMHRIDAILGAVIVVCVIVLFMHGAARGVVYGVTHVSWIPGESKFVLALDAPPRPALIGGRIGRMSLAATTAPEITGELARRVAARESPIVAIDQVANTIAIRVDSACGCGARNRTAKTSGTVRVKNGNARSTAVA